VLERLAEAVDKWSRVTGHLQGENEVSNALRAYRAATAPLRTREQSAVDLAEAVAWTLRWNDGNNVTLMNVDPGQISDLIIEYAHAKSREPTSGPGGENADPPPCAPPGATYSPLVERVLASDEPEICSCDEALALREKLEHIETECELYFRGKKLAPEAMTAIRGLLPCRNLTT
jgi:hypothetical protein